MSLSIPSTSEIVAQAIANFEAEIGQTTPLAPKAFLRVLAGVLGAQFTTLYKYGVERTQQALALTATGSGLDLIGSNYGVDRRAGVAAELAVAITSSTPTTPIPLTIEWVAVSTGVRYSTTTASVVNGLGQGYFSITAQEIGDVGNLSIGDELSIGAPVAGLASTAQVIGTTETGIDRETDDSYRRRVLNEIRTVGGGGNGVDYRTWAEEVDGVAAAYPYTGKPVDGSLGTSYPGDRSVFVQAEASLGTGGVAGAGLLSDVRDSINTDPDTGLSRPPLGMTDATLFVLSVSVTSIYVEIRNIDYGNGNATEVKADIESALEDYLATIVPYVDGVDPEITKNNVISDLTLSQTVQSVLEAYAGSASGIGFASDAAFSTYLERYTLGQGEIVDLGSVTYA